MTSRDPARRTESAGHAEGDSRRDRIVDTAARLFAERGVSNVSVRDVAEAAGVTHPLIYYYWSSKDELLAAAIERSQDRMHRLASTASQPLDAILALIRETLDHNRQYLQTLTRALLDGMPPSEWPGGYPGVEAALAILTTGLETGSRQESDARVRMACALAAMLGWSLVEEQLLEIVGLAPDQADEAREVLLASIRDILEPAVPGQDARRVGARAE